MKIIRVFPKQTSRSPTGEDCFFGMPPIIIPDHDEVHISTVFTWDIPKARELQYQWQGRTNKPVRMGGPAFNDRGGEFEPGRYVVEGITITSRGCNNNCPFCFVPQREGRLRELKIKEGNVIYDNNFTQCNKAHQQKVFQMLSKQKAVKFSGGLEAGLITSEFVDDLRSLRIKEIWVAADGDYAMKNLQKASRYLSPYFNQNKLRCFVLIGFNDTKEQAEGRLRRVFELGFLPFAQLYKSGDKLRDDKLKAEWGSFARQWSRQAIYKNILKGGI